MKGVDVLTVSVFEAKNLTKQYGNSFALENVNMTICSGEIYGLIGENGAGKTTLMSIIGNLAKPTSGTISLFGETKGAKLNAVRKDIGYLIEMPALYPDLSAKDNLEFYCRMFDVTNNNAIQQVLQEVSLANTSDKKVGDFSLGMRQRLGLAIALINNPKFLVLDEPINGLDPSGIAEIREVLKKLSQERNVAILISSHILSELQLLATKFGFIHKGRMLKEISAAELAEAEEKYIIIQLANPQEAARLLQEAYSINISCDDQKGEIYIPIEQIPLDEIISFLVNHDIKIKNVAASSSNLENYYMNLIGRESK